MITKEQFLGIIRHFVTAIGGIFIARGFSDESTVTELVGAGLTFIGSLWSVLSKNK